MQYLECYGGGEPYSVDILGLLKDELERIPKETKDKIVRIVQGIYKVEEDKYILHQIAKLTDGTFITYLGSDIPCFLLKVVNEIDPISSEQLEGEIRNYNNMYEYIDHNIYQMKRNTHGEKYTFSELANVLKSSKNSAKLKENVTKALMTTLDTDEKNLEKIDKEQCKILLLRVYP